MLQTSGLKPREALKQEGIFNWPRKGTYTTGVGAGVIVHRKCSSLSILSVGKYFAIKHNRYPGARPFIRFPCFLIPGPTWDSSHAILLLPLTHCFRLLSNN